jgi:hypothetical protein
MRTGDTQPAAVQMERAGFLFERHVDLGVPREALTLGDHRQFQAIRQRCG